MLFDFIDGIKNKVARRALICVVVPPFALVSFILLAIAFFQLFLEGIYAGYKVIRDDVKVACKEVVELTKDVVVSFATLWQMKEIEKDKE